MVLGRLHTEIAGSNPAHEMYMKHSTHILLEWNFNSTALVSLRTGWNGEGVMEGNRRMPSPSTHNT